MIDKNAILTLVSRLSIEQGYTDIDVTLFDNVPCTIEDYTNVILEAEGFTPSVGGDVNREARRVVREVFEKYRGAD